MLCSRHKLIKMICNLGNSTKYCKSNIWTIKLSADIILLFQNRLSFYGKYQDNLHNHVFCYVDIFQNYNFHGLSIETTKLRFFPHTLCDREKELLELQPGKSIRTWNDCIYKFVTKYFPSTKVTKLKHEISIFQQADLESFNKAWKRFKNVIVRILTTVLKNPYKFSTSTRD